MLRAKFQNLREKVKKWHEALIDSVSFKHGQWKQAFIDRGALNNEFCEACWTHAHGLYNATNRDYMMFHIGPGKTDFMNEDKILVECRVYPKNTSVTDDKMPQTKRGLVKTVFELQKTGKTETYVRVQNEAGIFHNKVYEKGVSTIPRRIVILVHPPKTVARSVTRMYTI